MAYSGVETYGSVFFTHPKTHIKYQFFALHHTHQKGALFQHISQGEEQRRQSFQLTMANTPRLNQLRDDDNCGLHHLVEAATALTQLVSSASRFPVQNASNNDESLHRARVASFFSQPVSSLANTVTSHVPIAPNANITDLYLDTKNTKKTNQPSCPREIFPQRLMRILSDLTISDVITWLPHGRSFVILQPEVLAERVLPAYFPESASSTNKTKSSSCKYPSFTRKLNRWGFRQVTRGPDAGAFHHKLFCRDEPGLCLQMICQRSRRHKDVDKSESVSILPRSMSQSSDLNLRAVTDTESLSSTTLPPSSLMSVSSIASTLSPNLGNGQVLTKEVYRTNSPTLSITRNTAIVSNTASPTPRTVASPSNPDIQSTSVQHIAPSQHAMVSSLEKRHTLLDPALLQQHSTLNSVTAGAMCSGKSNTNPIVNSSPLSSNFSSMRPQVQQPLNLPHLINNSIVAPLTNTSHMSSLSCSSPSTVWNEMPSCDGQETQSNKTAASVKSIPVSDHPGSLSSNASQTKDPSDEEARIANAKSLLYNAYLKALG